MNPFEVERLGWDTIKGLPIHARPEPARPGRFSVICEGDEQELVEEETVEAVSDVTVPRAVATVGASSGASRR